jgi:Tfp pilus assembly protein PilX
MITNQPRGRKHEYGATALLVVTFSILILTTISIGFMRLVVQDQNRTNNDELSRGAYGAALAGVEDGVERLPGDHQQTVQYHPPLKSAQYQ